MQHTIMKQHSKKSSQHVLGEIKGAHTFQSILQPNNQFPQLITSTKQALLCLDRASQSMHMCVHKQPGADIQAVFKHSTGNIMRDPSLLESK